MKHILLMIPLLVSLTATAKMSEAPERPEQPVVLITGAFRGLGLGVGELLLERGYRVAFAGRKTSQAPDRIKNNPNALLVKLDLDEEVNFPMALNEVVAKWGRLDVLVHNAGLVVSAPGDEISSKSLRQATQANFLGPVHLTQFALDHFKRQKFGRIIYISSATSILRQAGLSMYTSTKMAAEGYFETLAGELRSRDKEFDIDVSILRLSFVRGDYQPAVSKSESHAGDPELEEMMAWLRDHSPTTVKTVAKSVRSVIEAEDSSAVNNVGIDGKMMRLFSTLPTRVQDSCSRLLAVGTRLVRH